MADAARAARADASAVIGAADFRMVEVIAEADLRAHPLWADFRESTDRERILG